LFKVASVRDVRLTVTHSNASTSRSNDAHGVDVVPNDAAALRLIARGVESQDEWSVTVHRFFSMSLGQLMRDAPPRTPVALGTVE